jgi:hypothetical protein
MLRHNNIYVGNSLATLNSQYASVSTSIARTFSCQAQGMVYDQGTTTCKPPIVIASIWSNTLPCSSTYRGDVRFDGAKLLVCDGSAWRPAYTSPFGTVTNPASSCSQADRSILGNGLYYMRMSDNSVAQVVCESTTSRGSDGATVVRVASTCATVNAYFNLQVTRAYVDKNALTTPSTSNAVLVMCAYGSNLGGDGSSSANSATSCDALINYWNKPPGRYYVNGVLT